MKKIRNSDIKLSDLQKDNPFSVPDGYFDTFPERLMRQVVKEKTTSFSQRMFQLVRPQFALAGGLLLFALIGYVGFSFLLDHQPGKQVLTSTEINSVLETDPAFIDEYTLIDVVDEDQINSETGESNEDAYDDQVADYLMDHDIEMTTLIEQL
ncbi:MAG TPA: hypothetical protein VE912_15095 [Bacteroidales bacterium]|nr:hypothetical protein [Bacteroidales bacterium]